MFSQSILKNIAWFILRCLTASALLLFLSIPLHAAPEAILRLDTGGHTARIWKIAITSNGRQHPTTQVPRHMPDFSVYLR